jgi:phosphoribosylanthranilate isomerase
MNLPNDHELAAPSRVKIKICGMTNARDIDAALRFYVDAVGMIFAAGSPRQVDTATAVELSRRARAGSADWARGPVDVVGVFVDREPRDVLDTAAQVGLSVVQLHGNESPSAIARLVEEAAAQNVRVVKSLRVKDESALEQVGEYPSVWGILLDAYVPGRPGGTGQRFDWRIAARAAEKTRLILAGGLAPWNVAEAIKAVQPFMVDVASGVEEKPGRKDHNWMLSFIQAARNAAQEPLERQS